MNQAVAVRPLQCAGCGALVALGQGNAARCVHCGVDTPIPEEYRALQRAAASFTENRRLAHELYGRIGRPPGSLALAWGHRAEKVAHYGQMLGLATIGLPFFVFPVAAACAYLLAVPVALVIRLIAWILGYGSWIYVDAYVVLVLTTFVVGGVVGIPVILLERERAVAPVRRDIQASLAAQLPERPGGPSRCRNCGAALEVPRSALGVPCVYCGADNLVALPERWVRHIRASEFHQFMRIDAALTAFREASAAAQERFWWLVFGIIMMFPFAVFTGYVFGRLGILF